MKLAKAMATVAGLTGLSRIAGFIRDILTAAILGAGPIADAFFVALKLPNFFRRVTAEGAFSVAFVPLYSEKLEKEDRISADDFASNAFMVMLLILSVLVLLGIAFMPYIISAIAPGFNDDLIRFESATQFSRITFPYLLLMSLTALLGGVLNTLNRFAPFAFAPVLFNICLISALLVSGHFESVGLALSYGILVAGVMQLVWLLLCARRSGFKLRLAMPRFDGDIAQILKLMGPGVIGAGVMHINLFADMVIASFLKEGSISYLYYADRLNQLPLGIVGIAVGTALLPMLSKAMASDNLAEARGLYNRALEICLLLALPAAAALVVIPHELITVLFERGKFDADDSAAAALVLRCYALGLPAYIAIKVFSTAHWSRKDTKTPVKISVIATVINIALSIALVQFMGVAGIALATGVTAWLQFVMHVRGLKGIEAAQLDKQFKRVIIRVVSSACIMSVILYISAKLLHSYSFGDESMMRFVSLAALVIIGAFSYGAVAMISGAVNIKELKTIMNKRKE